MAVYVISDPSVSLCADLPALPDVIPALQLLFQDGGDEVDAEAAVKTTV